MVMELQEEPDAQLDDERAAADGRVLIVDDDPVSAVIAARVLGRAGYDCRLAEDADHAWQLLGPDVDLVLLDVRMPGQSGLEFLRRMRVDPILAGIPVLLATSVTEPAVQLRGLGLGAQGIVPKPIDRRILLDRVRRTIHRNGDGLARPDALGGNGRDALPVDLGEIFRAESGRTDTPAPQRTIRELLAERAALHRRLDAGYGLLKAILGLHQMVGAGLAPDRLARGILEHAQRVLEADRAVLWVPDGRELCALATVAMPMPEPLCRDGTSPPARAARAWSTLAEDEGDDDRRWTHIPLSVAREGVGVLSLRLCLRQPPSQTVLALFGAEAATALDASLRLHEAQSEALTDPLTGLLNRRGFEQRLEPLVDPARPTEGELSVLFLDLDHFKEVNDTFGHARGDALLQQVARRLEGLVRAGDVVARYGGDEFVVLLPATDGPTARRIAERVRAGVRESIRTPGNETLPITATIGVSSLGPGLERPGDVITAADRAMLVGKTAGRNRIGTLEEPGNESDPPRAHGAASALRALLRSLAGRHADSATHSAAVAALSARVARHLGCLSKEIREAGQAGLLHDIGKLYLPLDILEGTGPLTPEERTQVDLHTLTGAALVASVPEIRHLADHVRASQEHFDGSGYPDGRAGEDIPRVARIIAVTDAYHAMASDRSYRAALPADAIRSEFERCAGTQFDPVVVEALLDLLAHDEPSDQTPP